MKHSLTSLFLCSLISLLTAFGAGAAETAASSVLSTGHWVKVHVDSSAVYRIDFSTLRSWGFKNPENVAVYGYGSVEQAHTLDTAPDDLPQIPVTHIGDALYFFGEGDRRLEVINANTFDFTENFYSNGSNYFLTETAGAPVAIASASSASAPSQFTDRHTHVDLRTPRQYNIHSSSVHFFSRNIANDPGGFTSRFDVTDFASTGYAAYRYIFQHSQSSPQYMQMVFLGEVQPGSYNLGGVNRNVEDNLLYSRSVMKKIEVTPTGSAGFAMHFTPRLGCRFNILALVETSFMYERYNYLRGSQRLLRYLPASDLAIKILEKDPSLTLWDVTDPRSPRRAPIERDADGYALAQLTTADSEKGSTLCAFIPGPSIPEPTFVGEVECSDLHATESIDYLIVTTPLLLPQAQRLADAHRALQGLKVKVVTQDEVFNEFSSGSQHPNGLRKFVKMLSSRADRPLRYLLMLGAGTFDPKHYSLSDTTDYLVGYEMERVELSRYDCLDFNSDLYFAIAADNVSTNPADTHEVYRVAVGRAPVIDTGEAKIFVDKCIDYLSDPSLAGRFDSVLLSCCSGDDDTHLNSTEQMATDITATLPTATIARAYQSLYLKNELQPTFMNRLSANPVYVCYTGHSGPPKFGEFLSVPVCDKIHFGSRPIFYIAGCSTATVKAANRGIGTKLFLLPQGPICVIASGHEVYITNNHLLNEEFVRKLYSPDPSIRTLGDLWLAALNACSDSEAQRINNFCYNFLADPALPLRRPDRTISVSLPAESATLSPLSPNKLEGTVTLPDGKIDTDFNGTVTLSLYDSPLELKRIDSPASNLPASITTDETLLVETAVEVKAGHWSATITPPLPSGDGSHRLAMIGYSENGSIAIGGLNDLALSSSPGNMTADTTPPSIQLTIGDSAGVSSPHTSSTPTLTALLSDSESGLSKNASAVGSGIRLMIDDMTSLSSDASRLLSFDKDGSATLTIRLPYLTDGRHTVSLTACDMAGNSATATESFIVASSPIIASLITDTSIARDCITIDLSNTPAEIHGARIVVRDILGNTMYRVEEVNFPYAYDLRDNNGKKLPDGRYRVSALLNSHNRLGATPEIEFTVVSPTGLY